MRILYIPFFSNKNLGGCSIFNSMKVILRRLVETHEDVFVYYPIPKEGFDLSATEYLDHPRIQRVPVSAATDQEGDLIYLPDELVKMFNVNTGEHIVDLILCDKSRISVWVELLLNNQMNAMDGSIPLVNFNQFTMVREGRTRHYTQSFEYSQVLGWFAAHGNLWGTRHDFDLALKAARKYAKGTVIQRIIDSSFFGCGLAMDCDRIDEHSNSKPRGEVLVNYASRLGHHYKFREIFRELETLFKTGRKFKLVITTPSIARGMLGGKELKRLKREGLPHELHIACPQTEYYERASQCHVSLYMIRHSGATMGLREQIFMRQVVVAPNEPVYRELLPDYPFLYDTEDEMRVKLRRAVDNYWTEEVQEVVERYRERVREHYDIGARVDSVYGFFEKLVGDNARTYPNIRKLTQAALDANGWPDEVDYEGFREMVKKGTRTKRDVEATFTGYNRMHFIRALRELGYRDTCATSTPTYVRG
jgi:hypothetical protein